MPCMGFDRSDSGQINITLSLALALSNGARIDSWPTVPCNKVELGRFVGIVEFPGQLVSNGQRMPRCRQVNISTFFYPLLISSIR